MENVAPVRRDVTRLLSIIAHSFLPRRSQFSYTKYNSRKDKKNNYTKYTARDSVREGCGKSKWKFLMAFAIRGEGGLEGVSFAIKLF